MIEAVAIALVLLVLVLVVALLVSRRRLREMRRHLDRSEGELELLGNSVPQYLWKSSPDGLAEIVNHRFSEMTGIAMVGTDMEVIQGAFHPDDIGPFFAEWARARELGNEFRAYHRLRMADGTYHWMHAMGRPQYSETGTIIGWYGGTSDVDAEFRAQEEVRALNQELERLVEERTRELKMTRWRYRTLFDDPSLGVMELDFGEAKRALETLREEGVRDLEAHFDHHPDLWDEMITKVVLTDLNAAFAAMCGYTDGGEGLRAGRFRGTQLCSRDTLSKLFLSSLASDSGGFSLTTEISKVDGSRLVVACSIHYSQDCIATITAVDITERETANDLMLAAQSELARASRAGSIGAFSASIAHEVNQPLTSMAIDIETTRRLMGRPEVDRAKLQTMLDRVGRNAKRIADIITSIRERIQNRRRDVQAVKICLMIEDTKTLLHREAAARRANLVTHCTVGLRPVFADPIELQQVLVNLVVNALDAVVDVPEERRTIDLHLDPDGPERIRVRVADSGPGIPPDDLDKIFDPFYTTKTNGMGIGLQICRSIVEALDGELRAFNHPEGGAVFEFSLNTIPAPAETVTAG